MQCDQYSGTSKGINIFSKSRVQSLRNQKALFGNLYSSIRYDINVLASHHRVASEIFHSFTNSRFECTLKYLINFSSGFVGDVSVCERERGGEKGGGGGKTEHWPT